jgi:outer membrane protein OmpA-like peptidoglycan-associated protein
MTHYFIDLLKHQLNDDDTIRPLAGFLGENKAGVAAAVGGALSALLVGLMRRSAEPGGSQQLLQALKDGKHDGSILNDLGGRMTGGAATTGLASSGKVVLDLLFGDKATGVADMVATAGGIAKTAGFSLLAILAPIVMGALGKTLQTQSAMNPASLAFLLNGQRDFVKSNLPDGVLQWLGMNQLEGLRLPAAQSVEAPTNRTLLWTTVVAACLGVIFFWRSCGTHEPAEKAADAAKQAATAVQETAGKAADAVREGGAGLGKFFGWKLPNGVELNIPEFGVEKKLIAFIEDAQKPVDDQTWFSFDRLTFDTAKATLRPESAEQLKNIAEILKAYPRVTLKLGGYTDNEGATDFNMKLSQDRADNVMSELVKLDIDAGRLKAEGYGEQYPVATNDTEEGRAKNRRIDIRVTSK